MLRLRSACMLILLFSIFAVSCVREGERIPLTGKKILIFSKTAGYRHASIEPGKIALLKLAAENGIEADTTESDTVFTEDNLKRYSAVVFLNTTGNVLSTQAQAYFERYIQAGGGYVGIHAATDTEFDWPWYNRLAGAAFESHPEIQQATIHVTDKSHPATEFLPDEWKRKDEWYNFRNFNSDVHVLMNLDETSYKKYGTKDGRRDTYTPEEHPIAWYHEYDGGRAFYTAGGHTEEAYSEENFLKHVLGGINYAIGKNVLDYSKCTTPLPPSPDRFIRDILADDLDEPMELAVCPDGRVIFVERGGAVKVYLPNEKLIKVMGKLNVFSDLEDGLLGLTLHPDFYKNNTIFVYYSPKDKVVQRVSSFYVTYDSLLLESENIYMEIPVQREECCHSAGSLKFGPDRNLYISVGDNTNPHMLGGYAPIDNRPGQEYWDAGRTSANTDDWRGKILRIKPLGSGQYAIPDGNLFPKDGSAGKPEIYIMGCRNPYRISIDKRTGTLSWGEVGPDSHIDSTMGPRGYDEINRATQAGNHGWPYFIANNKPYTAYDFATGVLGEKFNPQAPVNISKNNTGNKFLPPAREALIWYPYAATNEFVNLGTGGRNAMAGPVYYYNDYPDNGIKLPKFYDNAFIIYDWIRDWVRAVRFNSAGKIIAIDPMFPEMKFYHVIDMEIDNSGTLYTLEYGPNWFVGNAEARLSRIYYTEKNIPPVAVVKHDLPAGKEPFTFNVNAVESYDLDKNDELKYSYRLGTEEEDFQKTDPVFDLVFDKPGTYELTVRVEDKAGAFSEKNISISVGNAVPEVAIKVEGNQTFYAPGTPINYSAEVKDKEDGSTGAGKISRNKIKMAYLFVKDEAAQESVLGHQSISGAALLDKNDCKSCHHITNQSAGPSYTAIATKYFNTAENRYLLANKVRNGGSGVWGEINMSAHPDLAIEDAIKIVDYILSVNESLPRTVPSAGQLTTSADKKGKFILNAEYTDKSVKNISSNTIAVKKELMYPELYSVDANAYKKNIIKTSSGSNKHRPLWNTDWFGFTGYDFNGLAGLQLQLVTSNGDDATLFITADSAAGKVLAQIPLPTVDEKVDFDLKPTNVKFDRPLKSTRNLFFRVETSNAASKAMIRINRISLLFER